MTCKCRICGKKLDTETAYKVVIKNRNKYYCSQDEYEKHIKEKEHSEQIVASIKEVICEILNTPAVISTYIYKEWKDWNQVAPNEIILNYLQDNKNILREKIISLHNNEFGSIKYLSAVLRNSLLDYQNQLTTPTTNRQIKDVTIEEYISKYLDPNLSFKPDMTTAEKAQAVINPLFIEDYMIAEAVNLLTYSQFLETPYWDAITSYKKEQAGFKCEKCGSNKHTCTHHKTYANHGYEHNLEIINGDLEVLCDMCHKAEHHIDNDEI